MNKRLLTFFVVLLLAFSLVLTGCQETITTIAGTQETPDDPTVTTTETTTQEKNPLYDAPINAEAEEIGVMTFNLRYDVTSHACMALSIRGPHLMEIIDKYTPDSVGFNEATSNWMYWLRSNMKERGYDYVGVGRDTASDDTSSKANGNEYSPIFYKSDKYEVLESDTFWLSKTPASPKTKGWGSQYNRICTYAVLKNKTTGETYAHFSTHLDHKDMEAQENSIAIIETYIRATLDKYGDIGVVLTGDFNTVEFEPGNPDYDAFTYNAVTSFMDDTRYLATELGVIGKTFMGYDPVKWEQGYETDKDKPNIDTSAAPIDFIFVKKGAYTSSYYTVCNETFTFTAAGQTWHNHPVSDHYGVFAKVTCIKPTLPLIKDDTKIVDYKATFSTARPDGLLPKLTGNISITTTLPVTNSKYAITNLLTDDSSYTQVTVDGRYHGYWEITLSPDADKNIKFNGLSFTTASSNLPYNLRVFVSSDGKNWEQVGECYTEKLTESTTYFVKTEEVIITQYVKLAFVDTTSYAKLSNVTLFAETISNGRIAPEDITVTAGPNYKNGNEGCEHLFDGQKAKFYFRQYSDGSVPSTPDPMEAICFKTNAPVTITHYNFVNANDTANFTGRLPRGWTLYGSTDGVNYVVIDQETNPDLPSSNYAIKGFTVDTPGAYQYYKLEFTCGKSGNVQFSEMELFETIL